MPYTELIKAERTSLSQAQIVVGSSRPIEHELVDELSRITKSHLGEEIEVQIETRLRTIVP